MRAQEVRPRIHWVGALDKESEYFDQLMPLPDGTSYNAYLVQGSEKTALVDGVEPRFKDHLFAHLEELGIRQLDYIISNHAEQDHSGAFPALLQRYRGAKIVCNEKCKGFLQQEHHFPDDVFVVIEDRQSLSLGDKTLEFIFAPWVHWPETMFTYVREDKVLFTCDLFGAHLAFDDLWVSSRAEIELPAKRYYAEIMMPFARMVAKHVTMLKEYAVDVLAPSHGPIYGEPAIITGLHERWTSDRVEPRVVIAYVSMHGSTKRMAEHLVWKLKEQGIDAILFDIMQAEIGSITMSLVNCATFVLCSPAYLGGLHPAAANLLFTLNGFKPNIKFFGFMGSTGWEKEAGLEQAKILFHLSKVEYLEPVYIKGYPKHEEFLHVDELVHQIRDVHEHL